MSFISPTDILVYISITLRAGFASLKQYFLRTNNICRWKLFLLCRRHWKNKFKNIYNQSPLVDFFGNYPQCRGERRAQHQLIVNKEYYKHKIFKLQHILLNGYSCWIIYKLNHKLSYGKLEFKEQKINASKLHNGTLQCRSIVWAQKFPVVQPRPGQNRVTWKTPSSRAFVPLQEPVAILASYVPHTQMPVWSNTSVVVHNLYFL